ncbi:MAG: hypothetical protein RMY30_027480 [Nostoc sp. CmiSLP01]|nr:hypothetical protein [Nostoc sp. CmiSLP01]MDZ8288541.1 hypothetical protein [Nostoc sp. ChiSLP01]
MNGRFSISAMGKSRVSSMCDRQFLRNLTQNDMAIAYHLLNYQTIN